MSFKDIFMDNNPYNEKNIVGFISFTVMIITMFVDIVSGLFGQTLTVHEYIYNSFLIMTLGSFGIAGLEKIFTKETEKK